ncbi:MAG: methylenetetrahydrofolate reductase [NAD(P)H] [Calditrichaeota bacterium]|nr:methylenetetrahydrofolate reductase [Calditrichota bacterium]RQW03180.1 MAG: methylenetetrahydrofolate reductase [NAD(P)H] [Calditrichota bacterium]
MQVIEAIKQSKDLMISLEITPPNKGQSIEELFQVIDPLTRYNPAFISVTYHQPQVVYEEKNGLIYRIPKRKKPGTVGICAAVTNRYKVDTVPHFILGGFSKFETEDALIDLHFLGIENIFAVRGDPPPGEKIFIPEKDGHKYASELVEQIHNMNEGFYLEQLENAQPTKFCIGVAGYPEKHYESPNFEKDLYFLKQKVDKGAHYIITQMFFQFNVYRDFVEKARSAGIKVPILPGIKPITTLGQLSSLPRDFHITLPSELVESMEQARTPAESRKAGIAYVKKLCEQLIDFGVPGIHIYTMGKGTATQDLLSLLFK